MLGKKFLVFEGLFVIAAIFYLFLANNPVGIYPLNGMTISNSDFSFEIENAKEVLLSIDENFSNPIVLNSETEVILAPGVYFWKVKNNFREGKVQSFTIQSQISLNLRDALDSYELINSGNVPLNITSDKEGIILGVNEIKRVNKDNLTYEAREI
jgi:hypothetical protein